MLSDNNTNTNATNEDQKNLTMNIEIISPNIENSVASDILFRPTSPPPPPPTESLNPGIQFQLYKLQEQIETLELIISEPQIIAITGVRNVKNDSYYHWKEKINILLYEACIPYLWTIDIVPDEDDDIDPNLVYIYFLNNATKQKAAQLFTEYLSINYGNHVYIL
jgi:hypothetical protein